MELVAHEPDVIDPVAACFDENGGMYVAEMIDYPYRPKEGQTPLGRVRYLRRHRRRRHVRQELDLRRADRLAHGRGVLEGRRVRRRRARHLVLEGHRRRSRADVRAESLHRLWRPQPAGWRQQPELARRPHDLRLRLDQRRRRSARPTSPTPRRSCSRAAISASIRSPARSKRSAAPSSSATRSTIGSTASCAASRIRLITSSCRSTTWLGIRILAVPTALKDLAPGVTPIFRISPIEKWRRDPFQPAPGRRRAIGRFGRPEPQRDRRGRRPDDLSRPRLSGRVPRQLVRRLLAKQPGSPPQADSRGRDVPLGAGRRRTPSSSARPTPGSARSIASMRPTARCTCSTCRAK